MKSNSECSVFDEEWAGVDINGFSWDRGGGSGSGKGLRTLGVGVGMAVGGFLG